MKIFVGILFVLLIVLQYNLWFGTGSITSIIQLKHQITEQKTLNASLEQRNQVLVAEVQDLKSGQAAIEDHARDDLGMVKPGETFYQLVTPH